MNRIKISDGDLVIVSHSADSSSWMAERLGVAIEEWIKARGLQDVKVMHSENQPKGVPTTVTVLTVNNVFDEEVLNNGRQQN